MISLFDNARQIHDGLPLMTKNCRYKSGVRAIWPVWGWKQQQG